MKIEEEIKQTGLDSLVLPKQPTALNVVEILRSEGFSNITFLGEGWSSKAYNAELGGIDCIIRIPKISGDGLDTHRKEHAVLEIIADKIKSVNIPRTHMCESEGLVYVVHEKINGNAFSVRSFERLSAKEQDNFSRSVATFLSELHAVDINELSNISGIRWWKLDTSSLRADFERYLEFLKKEGWEEYLSFNQQEMDALCNFVESLSSEPEVLLHRDFHEKNFVVDDNMHLVGVFDFCNASLAGRTIEFSTLVRRSDDGIFQEPLVLKKILSYYQQISGALVTFNDIVNQLKLVDIYCLNWLVSTDNVINNNKDKLKDCVIRMKNWLPHYIAENL